MPVPAVVPLLETTGSPPLPDEEEVAPVDSFPPLEVNALVGPPPWVKYTSCCPVGLVQSVGVLNNPPTVPGGSSCCTLSIVVTLESVPPQTRLGWAGYFPLLAVLTPW